MAVHVLSLLSGREGRGATSESIAASVNTNPVVIRRMLLRLRRSGIIATQKGAGAGSKLARSPEEITLAHIYRAVEAENPFLLPARAPSPECPVGREIHTVLRSVFSSVDHAIQNELAKATLADIRHQLGCGAPPHLPPSRRRNSK
jgi:Rrf2 family protein